jgi:phage pi2 protein 07
MFFQNVKIIKYPSSKERVVFQCDEFYFKNYGFYNLLSCDQLNQDVHIHFINVSDDFLNKVLNLDLSIDLSISLEIVNTNVNFYKLKSYYFTSRYFIADYLFDKNLLDRAYITDADIIFNERISIQNSKLGVLHYPNYQGNLWKQTGANFLFVSKDRKDFIKKIITEYNLKLLQINFENINDEMPKYERSNMYGLDQVCMSIAMQSEDTASPYFLNLNEIERFIGNKDMTCKIWSLTSKKNEETTKILFDRFKRLF